MNTDTTNAASGSGSNNTTATVAAPVTAAASPEPEFVAMPGPGQVCPFSGLKRGMLYQLTDEGLIRTITLRRKGTARGRRLIVYASLMEYLRSLDAAQNGAAK